MGSACSCARQPRAVLSVLGAAAVMWGALDVFIVVLALDVLALGESGVGFLERRAEPVACWAPPSASAWSGGAAWPDRSASASCSGPCRWRPSA